MDWLRASLSEHWQRYTATAAIMLATGFMLTCSRRDGGFHAG